MKTHEQWLSENDGVQLFSRKTESHNLIKRIQQDALNYAADLIKPSATVYQNKVEPWLGHHDFNHAESLEKRIRTASENL